MTKHRRRYLSRRNALMLPIVLLVRVPIMLILSVLIAIGETAEAICDDINPYLPALKPRRP